MVSNNFEAVYAEVRELSLSDFLDSELNVKGKPLSGTVRYSECPWCGLATNNASNRLAVLVGDRMCHCHRCKEGGDVVKPAMKLWGTGNWETALRLADKSKNTSNNVSKQLRSVDLRKDIGGFTFPRLRQILVELGTKEAFQG